jgi:hypothetical protein
MKKLILLLFISAGTQAQNTENELQTLPAPVTENLPVLDVYGVLPRSFNGAGAGFGVFSPVIPLPPAWLPGGAELRLGGDLYFSSLDRRTIRNVPLQEPQSGEAKVKLNESLFGFNGVARFSLPWNETFSPYLDAFAGLRVISTGITITPNNYQPGYEKSSSDNLETAFSFNYGATAGMLVSLGPNVKLNAGVMFSRSHQPGSIGNIHSALPESKGLVMDNKSLPRDMILFKLGVTFRIDPSSGSGNDCCCRSERRSYGGGVFSRSAPSTNKVGTRVRVAG